MRLTWYPFYVIIAEKHRDSFGNTPRHCFFYPEEEYEKGLLDQIAEARAEYDRGEVRRGTVDDLLSELAE